MLDIQQARRALERVLLAFFIVFSIAGGLSAQDEELLREADKLSQKGDLGAALELFHRFRQNRPDDPRGYYGLGRVLTSSGRLAEASVELLRAVELAPHQDDYRLAAAAVLARLGDLDRATVVLSPFDREALADAENQNALWILADLYYRRELLDKALRVLERLSQLEADPAAIAQMRGEIHLIQGRFPAAENEFRLTIQLRPDSAPAHYGLGMAQWRQLDLEEAKAALEKAGELAPRNPDYRLELGRLLLELDELTQARVTLEEAEEISPATPEVHYELSRVHRRLGNSDEAGRYLERFNSLRSQTDENRIRLRRARQLLQEGRALLAQGRIAEARRQFIEAVALDSQNWDAHSYLAKIYLSSGMLGEASDHLFRLHEIDPDSAEGNFLLASYWYQARQLEKALESGLRARSLRPDYAELRNLLGNILFSLGRIDEAVVEYAEAVSLAPDRQDFRRNYETALKKK